MPQTSTAVAALADDPVERERRYRKEGLAAAFRLLARFDAADGAAGHITVRDPGCDSCFWVNPVRKHFSKIRVSDLLLIDDSARVLVEAAGTAQLIEPASAALTASQVGTPEVAKINFDCVWDVLLDEEPDFLD